MHDPHQLSADRVDSGRPQKRARRLRRKRQQHGASLLTQFLQISVEIRIEGAAGLGQREDGFRQIGVDFDTHRELISNKN